MDAYILLTILFIMMGLFIWGYWRYDFVAIFALIASTITGLVPFNKTFSGFANPAVITVACVMILSHVITQSGVFNYAMSKIEVILKKPTLHVGVLSTITGFLSTFINNVGSLGIMMPIALRSCIKQKRSPSIILMPIAASALLGGLMTSIGTPPNILISQYRQETVGKTFNLFDFTPVGVIVASIGILFISLIGWRFLPKRAKHNKPEDLFQISDYMTEVKVPKNSPLCNKTVKNFLKKTDVDFSLIAIVHRGVKTFTFTEDDIIHSGDILIIEAPHEDLEKILDSNKLTLAEDKPFSVKKLSEEDITIMEAIVTPASYAEGRSAESMSFRSRYSINILALSRKGSPIRSKLTKVTFAAGDIILFQGNAKTLRETIVDFGFLPLAERDIKIGLSHKNFMPLIFLTIAIVLTATNILPISLSLTAAILMLVLLKSIPIYNLYRTINWPVILLLAAIIPVGGALQTSGAADLITTGFMKIAGNFSPIVALSAILIVTMTLSDIMNNAATAVIMAPIAVKIANTIHVNTDSFLMAVAVGASSAFLTPISHQNNAMVMGPGGYKFFDYLRLGIPLEVVIIFVSIPTILWVWPL